LLIINRFYIIYCEKENSNLVFGWFIPDGWDTLELQGWLLVALYSETKALINQGFCILEELFEKGLQTLHKKVHNSLLELVMQFYIMLKVFIEGTFFILYLSVNILVVVGTMKIAQFSTTAV